ncbi:MAG: squalene--hopene cyclase, partial [Planctomycetaceae bacterium]|nr:squalene--hopene cyclase [Planctomycetaceae bacterium]
MMFDTQRIKTAFEKVRKELLARRIDGHWVGRLSSSPLSTATAISALSLYQHNSASGERCFPLLEKSVNYLLQTQNADGGWGDTDKSFSNISTTLLVKSSLTLYQQSFHFSADDFNQRGTLRRADAYIAANGGIAAIKQRYGKDNTFSVPILTNAALAGLADWKDVPQLPFERAVMPQWMFRLLNLQVVSYAIPALVAIGQVRFYQTLLTKGACPLISIKRFPLTLRKLAIKPTLKLIARMQPGSGGYLEAAPLTSFVAMSLLRAGNTVSRSQSEIIENCIKFLLDTVREDGSWAIDTNLAAWATTLSVNALGKESFNEKESEQLA